MSSNEKVKFRSIPIQENDRPLSTYDNLNNDTKLNGTNHSNNTSENECIDRGENANEFPFTGISFRFDELKQLQPNTAAAEPSPLPIIHTSNGYDNVTNNNYKLHRSNNTNNHNNNHNHHHHHNEVTLTNGNGVSQLRQNNQGHNTVTTIAQNHHTSASSAQSPSPTSSASSSSSSASSSSTENNYKQSSLQYSNLAGNSSISNRNFSKPVHSPAKSQFLGLHKATAAANDDESQVDGSKMMKMNGVSGHKNSLADEVSTVSDEEPLLNNYGNNRAIANGLNRSSNNAQYQNIPSNSSCYGQNQIDNANECTCTCKSSDPTNEIQQYESDRYKCNGCLTTTGRRSSSDNGIQSASMNVPSCSKMVDLSSCTTSMKPAKSTPLDTSSSFRMNQSSLSQVKHIVIKCN